jgi:hypothetical protein
VIVHFANSTEDQADRLARLGCIVSTNPDYPIGFADRHGEFGLDVHCWGGTGRTSTVVGCLLVDNGLDAHAALADINRRRASPAGPR